jgi:hypothetical protein
MNDAATAALAPQLQTPTRRQCPSRVLFAVAEQDSAGGRAEVGMLLVMVISGDHIHLVGNGVFHAGPIDVEILSARPAAPNDVLLIFVLLNA